MSRLQLNSGQLFYCYYVLIFGERLPLAFKFQLSTRALDTGRIHMLLPIILSPWPTLRIVTDGRDKLTSCCKYSLVCHILLASNRASNRGAFQVYCSHETEFFLVPGSDPWLLKFLTSLDGCSFYTLSFVLHQIISIRLWAPEIL